MTALLIVIYIVFISLGLPDSLFGVQLIFGFLASATTFTITPFVLLALCAGVLLATVTTLNALKKEK